MAYQTLLGWLLCCVAAFMAHRPYIAIGQVGVSISPQGVKLQGFGEVDPEATIEHWAEEEHRRTTNYIGLHIELLRHVCDLSENEVNKLQLAARGVAARRVNSGKQQLKQFMTDSDLIPSEGVEDVDDQKTPAEPADIGTLTVTGAYIDRAQEGLVGFETQFVQPLLEHSLWQGVLKSTLTAEQFENYAMFMRARNTQFLKTSIASAIANLDSEVCLSESQREKLADGIVKMLAQDVTVVFPGNLEQSTEMVKPVFADIEKLRPFLREDQVQRLIDLREARRLRGVRWSTG